MVSNWASSDIAPRIARVVPPVRVELEPDVDHAGARVRVAQPLHALATVADRVQRAGKQVERQLLGDSGHVARVRDPAEGVQHVEPRLGRHREAAERVGDVLVDVLQPFLFDHPVQEHLLLLGIFVSGAGQLCGFLPAALSGCQVGKRQLGIDDIVIPHGIDGARHMCAVKTTWIAITTITRVIGIIVNAIAII